MPNPVHGLRCAWVLLLVAWTGCAGYRYGSALPENIRSVTVPTCGNDTGEPGLEFEATKALKQALQRDGSLTIGRAGKTDALLTVTLTRLELLPVGYQSTRTTRAEAYRMVLTASMTFQTHTDEGTISRTGIQGDTTFTLTGDLGSSKRAALPAACRDLAHDIVETVTEAW